MSSLRTFKKIAGLPSSIRTWKQAAAEVIELRAVSKEAVEIVKESTKGIEQKYPVTSLRSVRDVWEICGGKKYTPLSNFYAMLEMAKIRTYDQKFLHLDANYVIAQVKERPHTWFFTFDAWLIPKTFRGKTVGIPTLMADYKGEEPPVADFVEYGHRFSGAKCNSCAGSGLVFDKKTYQSDFCGDCNATGLQNS